MPGTSRDAIAENAAIEHQIAEDEAESLERQTAERQLEILESGTDHEKDPGEPPRDENAYESMDIDYEMSPQEVESLLEQDTMECQEAVQISYFHGIKIKNQNWMIKTSMLVIMLSTSA